MRMMAETKAETRQQRRVRPGILVAAAVLVGLLGYGVGTAEHRVFDLGYSVGESRAVVQTWSVSTPLGYDLVWWQSDPPGPQDGLRLFPSE